MTDSKPESQPQGLDNVTWTPFRPTERQEQVKPQAFEHQWTMEFDDGNMALRVDTPGDIVDWNAGHKYFDLNEPIPSHPTLIESEDGRRVLVLAGRIVDVNKSEESGVLVYTDLWEAPDDDIELAPIAPVTIGEDWEAPGLGVMERVKSVTCVYKGLYPGANYGKPSGENYLKPIVDRMKVLLLQPKQQPTSDSDSQPQKLEGVTYKPWVRRSPDSDSQPQKLEGVTYKPWVRPSDKE